MMSSATPSFAKFPQAPEGVNPPVAEKIPHVTVLGGERRVDNYFWLRDKSKPKVKAYLDAENAYTDAVMKPTAELQKKIYKELLSHIKQTDLSVPYRDGEYFYYGLKKESSTRFFAAGREVSKRPRRFS